MSPLQKRLVAVGLSLQSAKGAAAAEPQFLMGVKDGKPAQWEIDEGPIQVTAETPLWSEVDRTSVVPGGEFTGLAHPRVLGLILFAALGDIASSGVASPFQHIVTPANDLPYLTFFGRAFGGDYLKVADCKVDELEISWENAGHLSVAVTLMGVKLTWSTTAFNPELDESVGGTPLFRASGGTFKVHPSDSTPVERNIISGSVSISNSTEAVPQSGSVEPSDVAPAVKEIEATIAVAPDDLLDIRRALTGADAGTEIGQLPSFGSFEWLFTIDPDTDLKIESPRFQVSPEMPDADPSGGFVEVELSGAVLQPLVGAGLTCTLRNEHEEYVTAAV